MTKENRQLEHNVNHGEYTIMIWNVKNGTANERTFTVGNKEYRTIEEARADIDSWNQPTTITKDNFKEHYDKCKTYGDWDDLISKMDPDFIQELHTHLQFTLDTVGGTMREESFCKILRHHVHLNLLPAEPAKQVPLMVKTTLGDWNNGHTSMNANSQYKGTTTCWGIMVAGVKTIAFRRKMDAQLFCDFVDFTEYNGSGDPESMFFKWVVEQSKDIDLDAIKVVG